MLTAVREFNGAERTLIRYTIESTKQIETKAHRHSTDTVTLDYTRLTQRRRF